MAKLNYEKLARKVLPTLVRCAHTRKTITYGNLARKLGIHHRHVRWIAGYVRDEFCWTRNLPLLNCLIVNKQTSFPGDSYTPEGSHDLSAAKKREEFEEYRDEVFEYTGWDKLLEELGIPPIKPSLDDLEDEAHAHNELLNRRGGGGENDEHRKLKEFIANHPKRLGISPLKHFTEFDLLSGDTVDVAFDCGPKDWAVVEVKVGQRGELIRGVYQAIKYRALMVAEKGRGKPFGVTAHLVAYEMPKEIERLARLFQVKTHNVPKAKVFSL